MNYLFTPSPPPSVTIIGSDLRFPIRRIYCLVRNYVSHSIEMGHKGTEEPFFFIKASDSGSIVIVEPQKTATINYPSQTNDLHHEIELVIAIGKGGQNINISDAKEYIYGYAAGLDMTRRDLQKDLEKQGRPWCVGKSFDHGGVIGAITPASQIKSISDSNIYLEVNGKMRQNSIISDLIWDVPKIIEQISRLWTLAPGDLIYTGTPGGVGAVVRGDIITCGIGGLTPMQVNVE